MTPKLNEELRNAIHDRPGAPVTVEDDQTHVQYVLISLDQFQRMQRLLYDDSDFNPAEALPAMTHAFGGPEGWDAPGMEAYDDYDAHRKGS